ncbi:GlxA family transcriptional regulator [Streptomyces formicae]|uniref:Transcriptional regulator, AraC family n=1 Tax=Streptomyces formicae TaxID=1616117 RepID=A0A291Q262_9ACTN|nr:helix-turn-helix domain-containing protein [Streptomyces formicae]ATL25587.1 Transcriptional regulator, AraC family [Streptomyces formicae]
MPSRSVLFILTDKMEALDTTGPATVFDMANRLLSPTSPQGHPYTLHTASPDGDKVRASGGLIIVPDSVLEGPCKTHTIVLPNAPSDLRVAAWLRDHSWRAERVVAPGGGATLLAESGFLNGVRTSTHWSSASDFATKYPKVKASGKSIFIHDGRFWTGAGFTSSIDMALALVEEDYGQKLSLKVARQIVVFLRRPYNQSQISTQLQAQITHRDSIRKVLDWILEHPRGDLSVEELARRASLSPRQFTRVFTKDTGMPPGQYVAKIRFEMACRRLANCRNEAVAQIADLCGYRNAEAMRRAFRKMLKMSPLEYRSRN